MGEAVVYLRRDLKAAKTGAVYETDILSIQQQVIIDLIWRDAASEIKNQIKRIKHERALEKFAKKAA